jgi:hypothetical protein
MEMADERLQSEWPWETTPREDKLPDVPKHIASLPQLAFV